MSNLQNIIIKKRKELKLSLREAAKLIGISHSYLSTLEKGIDPRTGSPINPTPETLKLISKAYNISYETLMQAAGYIENDSSKIIIKSDEIEAPKEKYQEVHDVEEAMKIILSQPGLMLKGELLSDESKIILANAIQMGLKTVEELEKKKNKGDGND